MRSLSLAGSIVGTVLAAGIVMAASPAPSPAATATPRATTAPKIAPTTSPSSAAGAAKSGASTASGASSSASTTTGSWSAKVQPLNLEGTAAFAKGANGTATLTMTMLGLQPDQAWSAAVYAGGLGSFNDRRPLFRATSSDLDRIGNGTLQAHLTAAEFRAIEKARAAGELTLVVSDGSRESVATFAKA